ncbi:hypothetical protein SAMN04488029_2777 [Reichenbachiella faecimaris]|uniref:Uncharacterized protein n=1 Tax=Reichenbachiella faecimaris TaxID=692418 RepID=A0A1W2GHS7_REIFA|nr:hypothetical protein SAMN04488029_2777 [Reichenbachiella faecimaris]
MNVTLTQFDCDKFFIQLFLSLDNDLFHQSVLHCGSRNLGISNENPVRTLAYVGLKSRIGQNCLLIKIHFTPSLRIRELQALHLIPIFKVDNIGLVVVDFHE